MYFVSVHVKQKKRFREKGNFVFLKFNDDLYFFRIPVTFDVFNDVNQHRTRGIFELDLLNNYFVCK